MLISEIIPYERNARHNERAIPKVAESIREFGLRETIGLESPEKPRYRVRPHPRGGVQIAGVDGDTGFENRVLRRFER